MRKEYKKRFAHHASEVMSKFDGYHQLFKKASEVAFLKRFSDTAYTFISFMPSVKQNAFQMDVGWSQDDNIQALVDCLLNPKAWDLHGEAKTLPANRFQALMITEGHGDEWTVGKGQVSMSAIIEDSSPIDPIAVDENLSKAFSVAGKYLKDHVIPYLEDVVVSKN